MLVPKYIGNFLQCQIGTCPCCQLNQNCISHRPDSFKASDHRPLMMNEDCDVILLSSRVNQNEVK